MTPSTPDRTRQALAALGLCVLLPPLGTSIANVALPLLTQAFDSSFAAVQWVVLAYLLAITTGVVGMGRLGDVLGRRRLLLTGLAVFTAASLACSLSTSLLALVAARAAQGLGAAVLMALGMAMVGDVVPRDRAGRAMGLLGSMSAVGTALGPSLGGLLTEGLGWRAVFGVGALLGVVAGGLAWRFLPDDRPGAPAARPPFDAVGTLLLALTLAAYALSMTNGRGTGLSPIGWLCVAAIGALLFVWVERRAASPLVPLSQLRDATLATGLVTSALVATVMMTTLVVGPFHLARGLGFGPAQVGLAMSAGPLVSALAGVPAGRWVYRFGALRVSGVGLAVLAIACVGLSQAPLAWGVAGYVLPLVAMTAGYALFQAANNTGVMADVPADRRGVVSGLLNLARNLGFVTGASAMGALFAMQAGSASASGVQAVAQGTRLTFMVASGLAAVAWVLAQVAAWRAPRGAGGPLVSDGR